MPSGRIKIHGFRVRKGTSLIERKFYNCFSKIIERCNNPKNKDYCNYGGRGIKCLWGSFVEFQVDMFDSFLLHIKKEGARHTTIDRLDSNGNYCKENCRWANYKIQQNNRTNNHRIFAFGEEKTLTQWADEFRMSNKRLWARLTREKMPIELALTKPLRQW